MAENGGLELVLGFLKSGISRNDNLVAKSAISLISQVEKNSPFFPPFFFGEFMLPFPYLNQSNNHLISELVSINIPPFPLFYCQLAGNDDNKLAVVSLGGIPLLLTSATHFSNDPGVPQEVITVPF